MSFLRGGKLFSFIQEQIYIGIFLFIVARIISRIVFIFSNNSLVDFWCCFYLTSQSVHVMNNFKYCDFNFICIVVPLHIDLTDFRNVVQVQCENILLLDVSSPVQNFFRSIFKDNYFLFILYIDDIFNLQIIYGPFQLCAKYRNQNIEECLHCY